MSTLGNKDRALLEKHIDSDEDDILAELEAEDDSALRAKRAQQLSEEIARVRPSQPTTLATDTYKTLASDEDVLRFTTEHQKTVVHFSHSEFARCSTMDVHLRQLADAHATDGSNEVQFAKVDVKDAGFVVEKLGVRVLPCVVGFEDGQGVGRVVGFDGVVWPGAREDAVDVTKALEEKLLQWKLVDQKVFVGGRAAETDEDEEEEREVSRKTGRRGLKGRKQKASDDEDDWD